MMTIHPARLVFIEETCTHTKMVRLYGCSPHGERLIGYAPHEHWKTITFVTGLRLRGRTAPFVLEGAMNGPTFLVMVCWQTRLCQCLPATRTRHMDHLQGRCQTDAAWRDRSRRRTRSCREGS